MGQSKIHTRLAQIIRPPNPAKSLRFLLSFACSSAFKPTCPSYQRNTRGRDIVLWLFTSFSPQYPTSPPSVISCLASQNSNLCHVPIVKPPSQVCTYYQGIDLRLLQSTREADKQYWHESPEIAVQAFIPDDFTMAASENAEVGWQSERPDWGRWHANRRTGFTVSFMPTSRYQLTGKLAGCA